MGGSYPARRRDLTLSRVNAITAGLGVFAVASLVDAVRVPRRMDEVFFMVLLAIALYDLYASVVLEEPMLKPWVFSGLFAATAIYFSLTTTFLAFPHLVDAVVSATLAIVFVAIALMNSRKRRSG